MTFYAFGLNHETAPVRVREAFALGPEQQSRLYRRLTPPGDLPPHQAPQEGASSRSSAQDEPAEVVLLSTCNRTEVYLHGTDADIARIKRAICQETGRRWPRQQSFLYEDEEAVRHVLQVTCGLRSLVLGDAQILSQVKDAYRRSVEEDGVITVLHRLMHTAFRAAKGVTRQTALSVGAASVSSAAVGAAREFFAGAGGIDGKNVVLLGAGRMGVLALEALQDDHLASLRVANRTRARAEEVAARFDADVIVWEGRHRAVAEADLVIVATGAGHHVVQAQGLQAEPQQGDTLLIDIAVPRNVSPDVAELEGYQVCDLDALNDRLVATEEARRQEVPAAEAIVEEELSEFVSWYFHQQALQPAIHAVRDTFDAIRREEINRHVHRFSEADRTELDRLTRSILQKVLAVPIVRLKSVDPESIDFVRGIKLLHALFSRPGCEDDTAGRDETASDEPAPAELMARLREQLSAVEPSAEHNPPNLPQGRDANR